MNSSGVMISINVFNQFAYYFRKVGLVKSRQEIIVHPIWILEESC